MVGSCEVLQTITHSFNSFREKTFMTIHLPVQTKQFNLNLKRKVYVKRQQVLVLQWLKWCSCCEGHYAGRVDFGIDFNVSPYALHSIYHEQKVHIQKQCQSSVCVCECLREKEWTSGFIRLADIMQNNLWSNLVGNSSRLATDLLCLFPERSSAIFVPTCFQPNSRLLL